jgi:histidinol-phosphate phosphatase family protein
MNSFPTWITDSFSLFLDRDGVLNEEIPNDYVRQPEQLVFYPGVLHALQQVRPWAKRMIVVTNQRGVGRGWMTESDLQAVHLRLEQELAHVNVALDGIFYCTDVDSTSGCRKPNTGMGIAAQQRFPDIVFQRSIMIGNSISDMEFGRNLGMCTVFLQTTKPQYNESHPAIDLAFPSLSAAIDALLPYVNSK